MALFFGLENAFMSHSEANYAGKKKGKKHNHFSYMIASRVHMRGNVARIMGFVVCLLFGEKSQDYVKCKCISYTLTQVCHI